MWSEQYILSLQAKSPAPKVFWSSKTSRQKSIIATVALCSLIVVVSCLVAVFYIGWTIGKDSYKFTEQSELSNQPLSSSVDENEEICTTTTCVEAANYIVNFTCNNTFYSIVQIRNMNQSADPCNDFYEFSCGRFLRETEIPVDASHVGVLSILKDQVKRQIRCWLTVWKCRNIFLNDENDCSNRLNCSYIRKRTEKKE